MLMSMKHGLISRLAFLDCAKNCIWASSPVFRRQQYLIRSLGASGRQAGFGKMQNLTTIEDDADSILTAVTSPLDPSRHKGQGADLSHVFCTKDAAPVIKSCSPELIVAPYFGRILQCQWETHFREEDNKSVSSKVLAEVDKWIERFDCLVIGPGIGRDPFLLECVSEIMKQARKSSIPMVIDGEYKRLVQKVLSSEVNELDAPQQMLSLAKQIGGVTILRKGKSDLISDGDTVKAVSIYGSPRRCGGQGDILSGSVAVFLSWARQHILAAGPNSNLSWENPLVLGCIAGSTLMRKAASLAFLNKKRSTITGDIIECLGRSLEEICRAS